MGASGSNPSQEKDPPSTSHSPAEVPAVQERCRILVVEDNKADVFLIREALKAAGLNADLHVVQDGEKAIRFVGELDQDESLECPALLIIDINLPRRHGGEVVERIRKSRRCANALVLVLTSSDSERDREDMAKLGVNAFFRKPSDYESFLRLGDAARRVLAGRSERSP